MPSSRHQDHATSPSAKGAFVLCTIRVHRIPPNVRDDGQRPSLGRDGRRTASDLPDALSEIFFAGRLDSPNQFEAPRQIGVLAQVIFDGSSATAGDTITPRLIRRHGPTGSSPPWASVHKGHRPWRRIPHSPTSLTLPS